MTKFISYRAKSLFAALTVTGCVAMAMLRSQGFFKAYNTLSAKQYSAPENGLVL